MHCISLHELVILDIMMIFEGTETAIQVLEAAIFFSMVIVCISGSLWLKLRSMFFKTG
jgi:hypothetical protein